MDSRALAGVEWGGVGAAALCAVGLVLAAAGRWVPSLNADDLSTSLLLADLVQRGGDVIWHCATNFYFFPSFLFVGIGQALARDPGHVHTLAFALHAACTLGAVWVYLGVAVPGAPRRSRALVALAFLCLYLASVVAWPSFGYTTFSPASHGTHFPLALLVTAGLLAATRRRLAPAVGAGLFVLAALLFLSDSIFVFWLAAPWLGVAVLAGLRGWEDRTRVRDLVLLLSASLLASAGLKFAIEATGRFEKRSPGADLGAALESFARFRQDLGSLPEALPVALLVAGAALLAAAVLRAAALRGRAARDAEPRPSGPLFAALAWMAGITVAGLLITLPLPILTGNWESQHAGRYLANAVFLPLLWLAHLALALSQLSGRRAVLQAFALASVAAGLAVLAAGRAELDPERWRAPYPDWIAQLDQVAASHDLKRGLAGYWRAKPARAFSHRGLRLDPVTHHMLPFEWFASADWFFREEPYDFVVVEGLDPRAIERRLGPPREVVRRGELEVWIYDPQQTREATARLRAAAQERVRSRGLLVREAWR